MMIQEIEGTHVRVQYLWPVSLDLSQHGYLSNMSTEVMHARHVPSSPSTSPKSLPLPGANKSSSSLALGPGSFLLFPALVAPANAFTTPTSLRSLSPAPGSAFEALINAARWDLSRSQAAPIGVGGSIGDGESGSSLFVVEGRGKDV